MLHWLPGTIAVLVSQSVVLWLNSALRSLVLLQVRVDNDDHPESTPLVGVVVSSRQHTCCLFRMG